MRTFILTSDLERAMAHRSGKEFTEFFKPFKSDSEVEYIYFMEGLCQSCKKYSVYFLLHVFSEGVVYRNRLESSLYSYAENATLDYRSELGTDNKLMMRKIGQ